MLNTAQDHLRRNMNYLEEVRMDTENQTNMNILSEQVAQLLKIENRLIKDRLKSLGAAMDSLGDVKRMQDHYESLSIVTRSQQEDLKAEITSLEIESMENHRVLNNL